MNPNIRFQLSRRCPSLKSAEKSAPLFINKLKLCTNSVVVNDISYEVDVYKTSEAVLLTYNTDLDVFGSIDFDLEIEEQNEILLDHRTYMAERMRLEREVLGLMTHSRNPNADLSRLMEINRLNKIRIQAREDRREVPNTPPEPPLVQVIEFAVMETDNYGDCLENEQLTYDRKLHDAVKYIMEKLFCGRKTPVHLSTLSINSFGILRIPLNMRFKIRHLKLVSGHANEIASKIRPIIEDSSFPLKSIIIKDPVEFDDPIYHSTQLLVLRHQLENRSPRFLNVKVLPNQLYVTTKILNWVQQARPVGTCWEFVGIDKNSKRQCVQKLMQIPGAMRALHTKLCWIILPANDDSEIHVTVAQDKINSKQFSIKLTVY